MVGLATTNPRESLNGKANKIFDTIADITLSHLLEI